MHTHSLDDFRHSHIFLGDSHESNERKTWAVIAICAAMMVAEIVGGLWFGSVALIADGLHMSTHAGALLIAALAYMYSRRYVNDERLTFGTGKFGDLAAFTSAIVLSIIALLIGYESVDRLVHPVPIAFNQAIPIAVVGLGVNLLSAFLLRDDAHHRGHTHNHAHSHGHAHVHRDTICVLLSCMSWQTPRYRCWSLSAW
jgi:cation diffusion facilitator family transporter